MTSPYLTPAEVAAHLHIGLSTVYRQMKSGALPFTKHGVRCLRIHEDDVARYELDHRVGRPAERRMEAVR